MPAEILQRHTELPWEEWSYAPFCYCPLLMSTSKAEAEVGLKFRVGLREWVQTTVDSYLGDTVALEGAKPADLRAAEVAFARKWLDAQEGLAGLLS